MAPTTVVLRPFATAWNMPYWFNCHSLCSTHGFSILSETLGLMVQPSVSLLIVINQFYWLHIRKNNRKKLPTQYGSRTQGLTEMCLQLPSKSIKVVGLLNSMPFFFMIVNLTRHRQTTDFVPGATLWWVIEYTTYSRRLCMVDYGQTWPSSIKPEIPNVSQRQQIKTEPRS